MSGGSVCRMNSIETDDDQLQGLPTSVHDSSTHPYPRQEVPVVMVELPKINK